MKLAALDVGTNTVLMLVVAAGPGGKVRTITDLARVTRLGRGLDQHGSLDPDAATRTLETIVEFAEKARSLGAERIVAVATSALRDASDGRRFIAQARRRAGLRLEVVSGRVEAELSYLAVRREFPRLSSKRLMVVDIGGGSTEVVRAEPGGEPTPVSLPIGSVRLTERLLRHDPPTAVQRHELARQIDAQIERLEWSFCPEVVIGIAGTVTTICAVSLGLEVYDGSAVHGHVLHRRDVSSVLERFAAAPLADRRRIKGLDPGRADVIIAGTTILYRLMKRFGLDTVTVSDRGIRWGLIWREVSL